MFILPVTDHTLGSIAIVLCALVPLAVEHHGVGAGHIIDHLLLHVAIRRLQVGTLVIILGGHVDLVSGVTDTIFACEAPLDPPVVSCVSVGLEPVLLQPRGLVLVVVNQCTLLLDHDKLLPLWVD